MKDSAARAEPTRPIKAALKNQLRANEITQWIMVLATKPDVLNSIPETHMVKSEKQLLKVVMTSTLWNICTYMHTHRILKIYAIIYFLNTIKIK